jgi:hypothetical protein
VTVFISATAHDSTSGTSYKWFTSCWAWLRTVTSYVDILTYQLAKLQELGDHATYNFLRYSVCAYSALLAHMSRTLADIQHPYTYMPSQLLECRVKCADTLDKLTRATADVVDYNDIEYMTAIFEVSTVHFLAKVTIIWPY